MANEAVLEASFPDPWKQVDRGNTVQSLVTRTNIDRLGALLATDLEWWFHRPPQCTHMMRVLTGEESSSRHVAFRFESRSVTAIGDCVMVESWEGAKVYWVHVWTMKGGAITQFREYFNTWLIVRDVRPPAPRWEVGKEDRLSLWQSHRDLFQRSLPGFYWLFSMQIKRQLNFIM